MSCKERKEQSVLSSSINGVGPITQLDLEPINDSLVQVGQLLFKKECEQCHTMEYENDGPDISDLLAYREPAWFVNFLLNKDEMLQRDSLARLTRKEYNSDCGAINMKKAEAIEILEYFRIYQIWLHEFNVK